MRAERGWIGALALAGVVGAVVAFGAPAVATHGGHPVCSARAYNPYTWMINGRPYVRATHEITCTARVDSITIVGRLKRDGQFLTADEQTCSGGTYGCRAFTMAPNPAGTQVWQATTSGSFLYRGVRHQVAAAMSQQVAG